MFKIVKRSDYDTMRRNLDKVLCEKNEALRQKNEVMFDLEFISKLPAELAPDIIRLLKRSRSQIRQDIFVLSELKFKTNGYFVEFGASDGVHLSNTYLLEKDFGWQGVLAEPAKCWLSKLRESRTCFIEESCVWSNSGQELRFNETDNPVHSTIQSFTHSDHHSRKEDTIYDVKTISLLDLLKKYDAPRVIDYLSLDTEGSELKILSAFNFDSYRFNVITCEHNYTPMREEICELLVGNGYVRKYHELSKFDDWYVNNDQVH